MSLTKWSPFFEPFEEFEKAMREFRLPSEKGFIPSMNVYSKGNALVVEAAIPDFNEKNVDISIQDNVLTVKGKTERKTEVDEKNYYRKEIKSGSFTRSVLLPAEVKGEEAKADYADGVLKISIPVKAIKEKKTPTIPVKVSLKKKNGSSKKST